METNKILRKENRSRRKKIKKMEEKLRSYEDQNNEEMKNVWKNNYLDAMSKLNKEMNKTKLIVSLFIKSI